MTACRHLATAIDSRLFASTISQVLSKVQKQRTSVLLLLRSLRKESCYIHHNLQQFVFKELIFFHIWKHHVHILLYFRYSIRYDLSVSEYFTPLISDLPGLQIAVKLLFLCEGAVPGLVILISIGGLVKLPPALRALYKLPVVIINEVPLRSLPLRVLVLPRVRSDFFGVSIYAFPLISYLCADSIRKESSK